MVMAKCGSRSRGIGNRVDRLAREKQKKGMPEREPIKRKNKDFLKRRNEDGTRAR